jgi:tetratricopeptide (TPR) repeat protein
VALSYSRELKVRDVLLSLIDDPYRLVRVQAAFALSHYPGEPTPEQQAATEEYMLSLRSRPDDPGSYYNLGNYYFNRGENAKAIDAFETSLKLQDDFLLSLVNVAMAYARQEQPEKAERTLRKAIEIDPDSAAANFNFGLLMSEMGHMREAEKALRNAIKADPTFAAAAYNLGVLLGQDRPPEAIKWCRKAVELEPANPKYCYTLAYYLHADGDIVGAVNALEQVLKHTPHYLDAYAFLGTILEQRQQWNEAIEVYWKALKVPDLPKKDYEYFANKITAIESR